MDPRKFGEKTIFVVAIRRSRCPSKLGSFSSVDSKRRRGMFILFFFLPFVALTATFLWSIYTPSLKGSYSPSLTTKISQSKSRLHWAAPIVIPVVSLLVLYAICLSIYLSYRRRKREKREKEDATPHQDVSRNNSVDSAITVQTFTETDDTLKSKPSIWLITSPPGESDITTQGLWKDDDGADAPVTRASTLAAHSPV